MFYTASYLSLSELTAHTILDLGLIVLNLALSTTTVILFTECCWRTILTFLIHCRCLSFIFSLIYMFLMRFDIILLNNICMYVCRPAQVRHRHLYLPCSEWDRRDGSWSGSGCRNSDKPGRHIPSDSRAVDVPRISFQAVGDGCYGLECAVVVATELNARSVAGVCIHRGVLQPRYWRGLSSHHHHHYDIIFVIIIIIFSCHWSFSSL